SSMAFSSGEGSAQTTALMSMCDTNGFSSSLRKPVSKFTTPPGRSLVANTSANVTAGKGCTSLATTTAVLPPAITGATTLTRPMRPDVHGAITPTTPVGSCTLKLKCAEFTGFTLLKTAWYLSHQPA